MLFMCVLATFPVILTRAPLVLQIFYHPLGGGGRLNTPIGSRLLLVAEKDGKPVKNDYELFQSNFPSGQNCDLQGPKMSKISSFSRLSNIVSENLHYLGNY